jgi:cytochrome c peroxidase
MGKKFLVSIPAILVLALSGLFSNAAFTAPLTPLEELGKNIYFDKISSPDRQACADCHGASVGFTGPNPAINKHGAVYRGAVPQRFGNRKPPSSAYATLSPIFHYDEIQGLFVGGNFWDGRATGQRLGNPAADQALGPFLNPLEQNNPDAAAVLKQIASSKYAPLWKKVWGEPIDYSTPSAVSTNYDRVGLSIAAFEGSSEVNQFSSKYDYFLNDQADLTARETWGRDLFNDINKGKCSLCHVSEGSAPLFTDFTYDNLGVPKNPENPFYEMLAFNPLGSAWIDKGLGGFLEASGNPEWAAKAAENMGKMKVPTLRNVDKRPGNGFPKAFMHNGVFKSLKEVVHFYNTRDVASWPPPEVPENVNHTELGNLGLSDAEEDAIVAFLATLSDGYVPKVKKKGRIIAEESVPDEYQIYQNSPNPFNPTTTIKFAVPGDQSVPVKLYIYDLRGAIVSKLVEDTRSPGLHSVEWNAQDDLGRKVSSGIYLYKLQAGNFSKTMKMLLLR